VQKRVLAGGGGRRIRCSGAEHTGGGQTFGLPTVDGQTAHDELRWKLFVSTHGSAQIPAVHDHVAGPHAQELSCSDASVHVPHHQVGGCSGECCFLPGRVVLVTKSAS
jgi:hypothetical protein